MALKFNSSTIKVMAVIKKVIKGAPNGIPYRRAVSDSRWTSGAMGGL